MASPVRLKASRGRVSNISVPHPAHDVSPVSHRRNELRRTASLGSATAAVKAGFPVGGGDGTKRGLVRSGSARVRRGKTDEDEEMAGAGAGADWSGLEVGAETRRFVASRLSENSKDADDEFEHAFRMAAGAGPDVVPSPSQRKLDRAHAESRRAREERQILLEMRLEAAKSSPGSASSGSAAAVGSPKFDYAAASSRGSTDALKQVQQFVRAQADAEQQAVIAELEQKTTTALGGPLGALAEDDEDTDGSEDEDAVVRKMAIMRVRAEEEEEYARLRQAAEWERVGTNQSDADGAS